MPRKGLTKPLPYIKELAKNIGIVRKKKPEIVHVHSAPQVVQQPVMQQPTPPMQQPTPPSGPNAQMAGVPDGQGYEWLEYQGRNYWRNAGSHSEWTLHQ